MSEEKDQADRGEIFNHALYHHVAHWAAFVALMGILLTVALLLSINPVKLDKWRLFGTLWAIIGSWFGALYFLSGMYKYGKYLNDRLPASYLSEKPRGERALTLSHGHMIAAAAAAATICFALDVVLVFAV